MNDDVSLWLILGFCIILALIFIAYVLRYLIWWWFGIDEHMKNQRRIIQLLEQQQGIETLKQPPHHQPTSKQPSPYDLT